MTLLLVLVVLLLLPSPGYPCNRRRSLFNMPSQAPPAALSLSHYYCCFRSHPSHPRPLLVDILLARLLWAKQHAKQQKITQTEPHTHTQSLGGKTFSSSLIFSQRDSFAVRLRFKFSARVLKISRWKKAKGEGEAKQVRHITWNLDTTRISGAFQVFPPSFSFLVRCFCVLCVCVCDCAGPAAVLVNMC